MQTTLEVQGYPGTIEKVTSSDTAASLAAATKARAGDGKRAIAVTITVETNDLRVCYEGSTPVGSGGTIKGHILAAGQSLRITNQDAIQNFKYVSKTAGAHGILHITPEFSTREIV